MTGETEDPNGGDGPEVEPEINDEPTVEESYLHRFAPHRLDADDLIDLRDQLCSIGSIGIASRVELERENALSYDDYGAKFTENELVVIGNGLDQARYVHLQKGEQKKANNALMLSKRLMDELSREQAMEQTGEIVSEESPTIDQLGLEEESVDMEENEEEDGEDDG